MHLLQHGYTIRFEWGLNGVELLAPVSDAVIIVDVLSFSTCVDIASARGALVFPWRWQDESALDFARSVGAELASPQREGVGYTLSPVSLVNIPPGSRLVLPSPNGSALSLATGATPTFAGCLRNARVVAGAAAALGPRVSVIAAGERWPDQSLRPAVEDHMGAGAVISFLPGARSTEAEIAVAAYRAAIPDPAAFLARTISGRELVDRGYAEDVRLAAQLNVSNTAPRIENGAYSSHAGQVGRGGDRQ